MHLWKEKSFSVLTSNLSLFRKILIVIILRYSEITNGFLSVEGEWKV